MKNYVKPLGVTVMATLCLHVLPAYAQPSNFGLKEMTLEESKRLHKNKIKKVHPNKLGLERINKERQRRGEAPITVDPNLPEMETEQTNGATNTTSSATQQVLLSTAPAQVDNSTMAAFPPIANQGNLGSCVAFASTYYMMSHEVCLTLGCDNKTYQQKVFSPKWTYNMINDGVDNGSYFSSAFSVLEKHGAAQMADFLYDTNYTAWDMNSEHWKRAITYRMSPSSYTPINTDAGMATVKQMLANGHVVIVGTYISSWIYQTVQANPSAPSNPFVGQYIVTYLNGTLGGHAMTIVGYDDTVWTDINGNGIVETSELGAFKIANSFGTGWKNQGYAWAAYDAFRATSAVPGFAPAGRVQLTQSGNASFITHTAYAPKLLAQVSMSHLLRSQISLQFGSSANTATSPSANWSPFAFVKNGGSWAFDGTNVETQGSFYFDISSLAAADVTTQKFYLAMSDSTAGSALTTASFNIVDPSVGNTIVSAPGVPLAVDAGTKTLVAGNTFADTTAPTVPSSFAVVLKTFKFGKVGKMYLSWNASTDNVAVAKYIIYRNNFKIAESTTLSYVDANIIRNVSYTYEVSAVDTSGNESARSVAITKIW
ncbi:MAG: C1 family peptidase [Bdellovibrio sp.]